MHNKFKSAAAAALAICLTASALSGCSKKTEADNSSKPMLKVGEVEMSQGAANLLFRYQQAQFESGWGEFLRSYYGGVWDIDLTGSGQAYGDTFKESVLGIMQQMVMAKEHMAEYNVELTDDEKTAIKKAAEDFIAANDEESMKAIGASVESAEEVLTLYTIRNKVENEIKATVDTEVADEDAAQRTVTYVSFIASTEAQTEETEEAIAETEAAEAAETEVKETAAETEVKETAAETEVKETAAETEVKETAAAVSETEVKTKSADETEAPAESVSEEAEAVSTEAETEAETEDPAMVEAREVAKAKAEAFLESAKSAADFETAAQEAAEEDNVNTGSWTFGKDDTYPVEAIITGTEGLEDGTLVEQVFQSGNVFYVVYVTDAFDEDATAEKKEEIVDERKSDAVNAKYDEWSAAEDVELDSAAYAEITFNTLVYVEQETEEAIVEEAATDAVAEAETGEKVEK